MKHSRYSLSDPLVNMRLLSSSTKTYESIVIPSSQEDEFCNSIKIDKFVESSADKGNVVELTKDKPKRTRKFYIIGITIALLISFVLGIILFITVSDSTSVKNVMSRYFK
ncbi:hypothetical protein WA026_004208 [Henosepilachna vigintioctopunctata]|uniref:Uncharacterized protein n=1 Tax=Henosepilachna vigintioctopunctata TaxID=420089 RepID=A0AAW1UIX0_9CUCU